MKFAKGQEDVHVFSYQDHFNGQRRFLVSTYTEFWQRFPSYIFLSHVIHYLLLMSNDRDSSLSLYIHVADDFTLRYKNMHPKFRHHYEVIREVIIFCVIC